MGSTGVMAMGGAATTAARLTRTSIEAMPRTALPGAPPQATTDKVGVSDGTPATSNRRKNWRFVTPGSNTWKSFSASPANSSTLVSPIGAEARPRTVT